VVVRQHEVDTGVGEVGAIASTGVVVWRRKAIAGVGVARSRQRGCVMREDK